MTEKILPFLLLLIALEIVWTMLTLKERKKEELVGLLIIDKTDLENGSGVYLQIGIDPMTLRNEQKVCLRVRTLNEKGGENHDEAL